MESESRPVRGWGAVLEPALVLDAAAVSIAGPRPDNEDAALAGPRLLAVADGVGGSVAGAVAATGAVAALAQVGPADLVAGVAAASTRLGATVAAAPQFKGMATTLTAVALVDAEFVIGHVGDSRAYLLRDGELRQLTHDQTVVQSLVDAGVITEEQARTHPLRSVVLGALHGVDDDLTHLELSRVPARPGDRVLVCSDGLSGVVRADLIARVLGEEPRPEGAARRLVRDALVAGTHDNVTAVVADVLPAEVYSGSLPAGPPTS
jgi:serine/threonine protein phosphatase PrpC